MSFLNLCKKIFTGNNLFALILSVGAVLYTLNITSTEKDPAVVIIDKNTSTENILDKLQEQGVIKNRITYGLAYIINKISGGGSEPGAYYFRNGMSALAINNKLKNPDYKYVAIEEGWRIEQIADTFAKKLNWDEEKKNEFAANYPFCPVNKKEGYLSPGEYLISKNAEPQEVLAKMEERFYENLSNIKNKKSQNILDEDQVIKVASLIQREAAGKHDMRLISGVIWNRIFKDMPLQIDATLQYVKGDEENWWPVPKSEDKYLESPYNTYQNKGLPPTPIASPGKAAIEAAMNPLQTTCLFYLHDRYGNIRCSSDYKGHLSNIKRYL